MAALLEIVVHEYIAWCRKARSGPVISTDDAYDRRREIFRNGVCKFGDTSSGCCHSHWIPIADMVDRLAIRESCGRIIKKA